MYHVSAQGIDECMINVHHYYWQWWPKTSVVGRRQVTLLQTPAARCRAGTKQAEWTPWLKWAQGSGGCGFTTLESWFWQQPQQHQNSAPSLPQRLWVQIRVLATTLATPNFSPIIATEVVGSNPGSGNNLSNTKIQPHHYPIGSKPRNNYQKKFSICNILLLLTA